MRLAPWLTAPHQSCSSLFAANKAGAKGQDMTVVPLCKALTASSSAWVCTWTQKLHSAVFLVFGVFISASPVVQLILLYASPTSVGG